MPPDSCDCKDGAVDALTESSVLSVYPSVPQRIVLDTVLRDYLHIEPQYWYSRVNSLYVET